MKRFVLALIVLVTVPVFLDAVPSLNGPTGLIEMPTATSLEFRKVSFGIDTQLNPDSDQPNDFQYKFNLGTFQNCEIGIVGGSVPAEGVFVHAKYFMSTESERFPLSLAVGVENVGSALSTRAYLVSSKSFDGGFKGHFGFNALFSESIGVAGMVGMEYIPEEKFSLLVDVLGDGDLYAMNLGMRFYFDDDMTFRMSMLDVGNARNNGAIYSFGLTIERFL